MNRTESEVWSMTPRKLFALLNVHYDIERLKNSDNKSSSWRTHAGQTFIDQIPNW